MASPWAVTLDEDEGEDFRASTKDALVFLIDARKAMLGTNDSGEVYLHNAMAAVVQLLKTKIVASAKDLASKKNSNSFDHVYEFIELASPSATAIKQAESVMSGEFDFAGEVGSLDNASACPLHHALWACSMSLSSKVKDGDSQRVWLFTNDDNPNPDDGGLRDQTIQKAKDLVELGQDLTLWYMSRPDLEFNVRLFFAGIIPVDEDDPESGIQDISQLDDVVSRVRRKEHRKRAYARIPLKLAEGIELSVGVYNLIYPTKKPSAVQLETATNQRVKTETNWLCSDTGRQLLPHEIRTYQKFADSRVMFDKEDMKQIKNFGFPGLRLMGFKDISVLSNELNLRSPYFLYPNEAGVSGSTVAFRALQEKMIELGKVAIVRLIMRAGSAPRFAALVAQKQVVDEYGAVDTPAGMFLIPLPFSDDIRPIASEPTEKANVEQIAAAKKVVQCLNVEGFSSYNFDNPVLQKHYAAVQALALGEESADWEEKDDLVVPDEEGIATFDAEIEAFRDSFGGAVAGSGGKKKPKAASRKRAPAKKRSRASDDGEAKQAPAKRSRGGAGGAGAGDVEALARAGQLKKMRVPELKAWMKANGLQPRGRKADLIADIEEHFGV